MKIKKVGKVNPVAKHSRNRSGAGAHQSDKDYKRQQKHKNEEQLGYYNEFEEMTHELYGDSMPDVEVFDKHIEALHRTEESVASKLDRMILLQDMQDTCRNPNLWFEYEEEIQLIKKELQDVDI